MKATTRKFPRVILLVESSRESGRALLCGVASYALHHGPWSFYWETRGLEKQSPALRALDAEGIIMRDIDGVEEVLAAGLPVVIVGHRRGEIPGAVNVITDSEAIGRMGAEHLLNCGFRHYAFCGYQECCWSETRCESFMRHLGEAGFSAHQFEVQAAVTGAPWKNQRQAIARWLAPLPKPLALMACNDDLGQEVIEACKLAGLAVPDDVAVMGVDNDEVVCGLSNPPLSSIAVGFERAGYEAAHVLAALMRNRRRRAQSRIIVPATHVVPRRSTSILAVEDGCLAKALRVVRERVQDGVSVGEIARAAGISRRALEKRFRSLLGHSVLDEIRRVRTDHIARMLVETELPVAEIAAQLGFADVQHVARYFRSAKEMTPLSYRKAFGRKHSGQLS
jgi:LacI family transcriptional regulator